ncbi:ethanolamine utilization protein EutP [Gammaproteobacteria bacterium]|nr:ethanolamine utilization protein EutP [Gammaproteobacteria bacterium]
MRDSHSNDKFIFLGGIEAGKTTLFNALLGIDIAATKTQSLNFEDKLIDTPGEFFSHPRLYSALITTTIDVDTIVYVHPANVFEYRMPQGLLEIYADKTILAVITKIDLEDADPQRVKQILLDNNFRGEILMVSAYQLETLETLRLQLNLPQVIATLHKHGTDANLLKN